MDLHVKKAVDLLPNIPPRLSRPGPSFPVPEMVLGMWTMEGSHPSLSPQTPKFIPASN